MACSGDSRETRRVSSGRLTLEDRTSLLRFMLLTRAVEERGLLLYKQGKVPGSFYDGRGQEAISVGATYALGPNDPVCPLIRDLGAHLVKGTSPTAILGHYLGRVNGVTDGREGNVHFGEWWRGVVAMVSMLPDMMVVAVGMAMAFKLRGERRCSLSFFGDGATSRGDWHEAMNWASIHQAPVIFVLENNQWAYSTPTSKQFAVNPVERASGYGIPGWTVDGNDVQEVFEATCSARERALSGAGPTLIECQTMRMHGHGAHDDNSYIPAEVLERWAAADPIDRQIERLQAEHVDVDSIRAVVEAEVEEAANEALAMPMPSAGDALGGAFCATDQPAIVGTGEARWTGLIKSVNGSGA